MKTREQAEARAMELFPDIETAAHATRINRGHRQAYLQGWEEAQETKLREAADLNMIWTKWCESKSTQEFDEWLHTHLMNSQKH